MVLTETLNDRTNLGTHLHGMQCFVSSLVVGLVMCSAAVRAQNDTVNVRVVHATCDTVLPLAR